MDPLYVFPRDPYEVVGEIFITPILIPPQYSFSGWGDRWFKDFLIFLETAGINPAHVPEEELVYMALLFHTMDRDSVEWHGGSFVLKVNDNYGASLELYFRFPTDSGGQTELSLFYENGADAQIIQVKSSGALMGPINALSYVLPNKDIVMWKDEFEETITEGAYKGLSAKFSFSYIMISPRDQYLPQELYYQEDVDLTLPDATKDLNMGFTGSFLIPSGARLPMSEAGKLGDHLPHLFQNAVGLKSGFGGTTMEGGESNVLVVAFADHREHMDSFQQELQSMAIQINDRYAIFRKMVNLLEGIGLQNYFIDENAKVTQQKFKTLAEAEKAGESSSSRGYIVVVSGNDYVLFEMTSADLVWLAKKEREEDVPDSPRYEGIDPLDIEACNFFELPIKQKSTNREKLDVLKRGYYTSKEELRAKVLPYSVLYETESGFYGSITSDAETTAKFWALMDQKDGLVDLVETELGDGMIYQAQCEGIVTRPEIDKPAMKMIVDERHYLGRKLFREVLAKMETSKMAGAMALVQQFFEEPIATYLENSMARPAAWGMDPEVKTLVQSMQGNQGIAEEGLGTYAFAAVSGLVEQKGISMLENMMSLLDLMATDDTVMKIMLGSIGSRPLEERENIALIFASDEANAKVLVAVMTDLEKSNKLLMGSEVDGFTLGGIAERVKSSRDDLKKFLDSKKGGGGGSVKSIKYEEAFITQKTAFGDELRQYAYEYYGFDLDPKDFPHRKHVSAWFPSTFHDGGKNYTSLLEKVYINKSVDIAQTVDVLNVIKVASMMAGVFSLARGAGLWAVGKLGIEGTKLALVVEALVTSVVAGFILQGIKVAMGGKWSWEELGKTIGEAFVMMLFFGYINKFFKLPITQFSVNALAFIGIGVGKFYLEKKRLPDGWEFSLIIGESLLMMTLLHIGTKLTDPIYRRLFGLHPFNPNIRIIQGEIQRITADLAKESAKGNPNKAKIEELGEKLFEQLKLYRTWVEKNGHKTLSKEEVEAELAKLDALLETYGTAKMLDVTRLSLVSQMENVFYYKPGQQSIDVLKQKYGADNVSVDPSTGIAKVKTPQGEFTLIPESVATDAAAQGLTGESLVNLFGDAVRMLDLGVYSMGPGARAKVMQHYLKEGGKWLELGNDIYMAEVTTRGGTRRILFVEETATISVETALKMEAQQQGTGLEFLRTKLPDKAAQGLELLRNTLFNGKSDKNVLEALKKMQEEAFANDRTLSQELSFVYEHMDLAQALQMFGKSGKTKSSRKDFLSYDKIFKAKTGKSMLDLFPDAQLTELDAVAILRYTKDAIQLNQGLYGSKTTSVDLKAWQMVLNSALSRMPKYKGIVYRGAAYEEAFILGKYKKGEIITEEGFLSTTQLNSTADYYMNRAAGMMPGKIPTKVNIYSKNGVYVEEIAWGGPNFKNMQPSSAEVTFPSGSKFKVTEVQKTTTPNGDPMYEIYMIQQ